MTKNIRSPFDIALPSLFLLFGCSSTNDKDVVATQGGVDGGGGGSTATVPDGGAKQSFDVSHLSCGNLPARPADYRERPAPDACIAAVEASCCSQAEACAADPDCLARVECYAKCGNDFAVCASQCDVTNPANDLAKAWSTCEGLFHPECADLSCVGQPPPKPPETTQRMPIHLGHFGSPAPMDGVRLRVCALDDDSCDKPLFEATTDENGDAVLDLPPGRAGVDTYLEATGAATTPSLLFPHWIPGLESLSWFLYDAVVGAARGAIGVPDNPERGLVAVQIKSCGYAQMAGMKFASSAADQDTVLRYASNNFPSQTATMSDGIGIAGNLGNHPAGRTTITATDAATGTPYGSRDIMVRAGYMTLVTVWPSP